jgi:hypothetical protein
VYVAVTTSGNERSDKDSVGFILVGGIVEGSKGLAHDIVLEIVKLVDSSGNFVQCGEDKKREALEGIVCPFTLHHAKGNEVIQTKYHEERANAAA